MDVSARDDVCMAAVATVKRDLFNCPNWVSCFSNGIFSCYILPCYL